MDTHRDQVLKKAISGVLAIVLFTAVLAFAEVKQADKAGSWYPGTKAELSAMIKGYLSNAHPPEAKGEVIGLISPHAGYIFSAPVAAYGYKLLEGKDIKTVVIVGFNHKYSHPGVAVCDYEAYRTPLGEVPVDKEITDELIKQNPKIYPLKDAFADEQSTELQVPYTQELFHDYKIVVISIGEQNIENSRMLGDALYNVLKDKKDFVMIASTDMCHYLPYEQNNAVDRFTISVLEKFDPIGFYAASAAKGHELACGFGAVTAVMMACKKLGADKFVVLKHANSGDAISDRSRVVGYLSAAMVRSGDGEKAAAPAMQEENKMLTKKQKTDILKLARDTINMYLTENKKLQIKTDDPVLNQEMGAFVTLHERGQLRGCIGNMVGRGPFYLTVRDMAIEAATGDPRFTPVKPGEMKDIDIEVSALSPLEKITDPNLIQVGKHGVLVKRGARGGVYLPQVATETGWSREQFMDSLCAEKAGIPIDSWKTGKCDIYIFTADVFGEKEEGLKK